MVCTLRARGSICDMCFGTARPRGLGFNTRSSRILVLSSRIPFFGASSYERKVPGDVFNSVLCGTNGHKDYLVSGRGNSGLNVQEI